MQQQLLNEMAHEPKDGLTDSKRAEIFGDSGGNKIIDKDYPGAVEDLSEAIRLDPQNDRYYSRRGAAYYALGRHEEVIEDETRSIEIRPAPNALYNRAASYYKTGRDAEALDDLDRAMTLAREMPEWDFLIAEIEKLDGIIKDKSKRREDYYQALIGWENKESRSTAAHDDIGPELVRFVYDSMRVDEAWSIKFERVFVWWAHQLAQRVWAEDVRRDDDTDVTLMHVETDFLRNVKKDWQTYEALNDLNAGTSQFAFIYNPESGQIIIHSTVYVHRQSLSWSETYFLRAVGLQVSYAHRMAGKASHLFRGSEPDTSPHPENGFRPVKDEMVDLIRNFFIPMGEKEPAPTNETFQFTEKFLLTWFLATSGENGLTAEFPFSGDEPAGVRFSQGKPGVVTSLFTVNSTEGHPLLGNGLMMRMKLPVSYGREYGMRAAMTLNLLEATSWIKCHLNGAWHVNEQSDLVFLSFFPIAAFKEWELANIALSFAFRSRWAGKLLCEAGEERPGMLN